MSLRDRARQRLGLARDPSCVVCQQPVDADAAVRPRGEPMHRDCARGLQQAARIVRNGGNGDD